MHQTFNKIRDWPKGIRFYIALATGLTTAELYWLMRSIYGASSVGAIRLQETYAWIALSLVLVTVAIGPVYSLAPHLPGKSILRDARRMLGISAAWFASWHVGISYVNQFQSANPLYLPTVYQRAFLIGLIALLILLALAVTSFDKAFRSLGIWWFRLHRLVYAGILLILLHAFNIGVHATSWLFLISLTLVVGAIFAAQLWLGFGPNREPTILRSIVLCYGLLITIGIFAYGYTQHLGSSSVVGDNRGGQYETR